MHVRTLILGAGAAGLMAAGQTGADTLVVDHAKAAGEKIRISGGGRCNFTNLYAGPENFISLNPHFAKSALSRYTQWDFIDMVRQYGIGYHEKTLGQLFCDNSAKDIIAMLLKQASAAKIWLSCCVEKVQHDRCFHVSLRKHGQQVTINADKLVLATGGKSIPKMGATGLSYELAAKFGLKIVPTRAGLVPFVFSDERFKPLAGTSFDSVVAAGDKQFREACLFTHRGLSGPAVLQASSYWRDGQSISVNTRPQGDLNRELRDRRRHAGRRAMTTHLSELLPKKLVGYLAPELGLDGNLADWSDRRLDKLSEALHSWKLTPTATEGYRTAEVTCGGIDTDGLDARTMEAKTQPGLYCIGEAVDVTGWLGGYNFQWAWSSGWAAGQAIARSP